MSVSALVTPAVSTSGALLYDRSSTRRPAGEGALGRAARGVDGLHDEAAVRDDEHAQAVVLERRGRHAARGRRGRPPRGRDEGGAHAQQQPVGA